MAFSDGFSFSGDRPTQLLSGISDLLEEEGKDDVHNVDWLSTESSAAVPSPPGTPDLQFLDTPAPQIWNSSGVFSPPSMHKPSNMRRPLLRRHPLSPPGLPWEMPGPPSRELAGPGDMKAGSSASSSAVQRLSGISLLPPTPSADIILPGSCFVLSFRDLAQLLLDQMATTKSGSETSLKSRTLAESYRPVFNGLPRFNIVQSQVFDDTMYTNRPIVVCAPTGSGKTVVFELAIIRLLMQCGQQAGTFPYKIVYVSPIKALCAERWKDWSEKFSRYGLVCKELTGDTGTDDFQELQRDHVIITTPEKWDSMTRKWKDNVSLMEQVRLFCIDEVHLLTDTVRGPTMEAVISRMKTIQSSVMHNSDRSIRFIAVSATVPNADDVAAWLSSPNLPACLHCLSEEHRPVRLRKVVLSFPSFKSSFRFDMSLSYKLSHVIRTYSDDKPTLVFCSTRKGVQQAATVLVKEAHFMMTSIHRQRLQHFSHSLKDSKLRDAVTCGVAFHHAGLDHTDRTAIESLFASGDLPVLIATSTLAMGVNLPAHLVVVKSTQQYVCGGFREYSEVQVVQMIGRAGRPQFDTSATAVIMTRHETRKKYETLVSGTQMIESSLHHSMVEHINAEVVLATITDINIALQWIKSTFLYIRIQKNPTHYGIPKNMELDMVEKKLLDLCVESLKVLDDAGLVCLTDDLTLNPTDTGRIMARYYVTFDTMKRFVNMDSVDGLKELLAIVSSCKEFDDLVLRVTEKRVLNTMNSDKHRETIRFPLPGKIKATDMKINWSPPCLVSHSNNSDARIVLPSLIQATLGCIPILEMSLGQDAQKIFRNGVRITKCLADCLMISGSFSSLSSALLLAKCFKARLWDNSKLLARQLDKIGITMATALSHAGLTTWELLEDTNPRRIEMIVNRNPPFGNQVLGLVAALPRLGLCCKQIGKALAEDATVELTVNLKNFQYLLDNRAVISPHHCSVLVVGDGDNQVVFKQRIWLNMLLRTGTWTRTVSFQRAIKSDQLNVQLINTEYVGLDVTTKMSMEFASLHHSKFPGYSAPSSMPKPERSVPKMKKMRQQKTSNNIGGKSDSADYNSRPIVTQTPNVHDFLDQLHSKQDKMPETPAKRLRLSSRRDNTHGSELAVNLNERFGYRRVAPTQSLADYHLNDDSGIQASQLSGYDSFPTSPEIHPVGIRGNLSEPRSMPGCYQHQSDGFADTDQSDVGFSKQQAESMHQLDEIDMMMGREDDQQSTNYLFPDSYPVTTQHAQSGHAGHPDLYCANSGGARTLSSAGAARINTHGHASFATHSYAGRQEKCREQLQRPVALCTLNDSSEDTRQDVAASRPSVNSIPPHFQGIMNRKRGEHAENVDPQSQLGPSGKAEMRPLVQNTNRYTLVRTGGPPAPVAVVPPRSRSPLAHRMLASHALPRPPGAKSGCATSVLNSSQSGKCPAPSVAAAEQHNHLWNANDENMPDTQSRQQTTQKHISANPVHFKRPDEPHSDTNHREQQPRKQFTFVNTRKTQKTATPAQRSTQVQSYPPRQSPEMTETSAAWTKAAGCHVMLSESNYNSAQGSLHPGLVEHTMVNNPEQHEVKFPVSASTTVIRQPYVMEGAATSMAATSSSMFCSPANVRTSLEVNEDASLDGVFDGLLWT